MPHPHFRTTWEENSYWKHYTNYMESKLDDAELELAQQPPQPPQPPSASQPPPVQTDGWTLVTRGRRGGQKK